MICHEFRNQVLTYKGNNMVFIATSYTMYDRIHHHIQSKE